MNPTHRARAYLAKLPAAIAGSSGHATTFAAACRLVEFGLHWEEAWPIFTEWNLTHCEPQWNERDLHHKLADAYRRTQPSTHFAQRNQNPTSRLQPVIPPAPRLAHSGTVTPCTAVSNRPALPLFTPGTTEQHATLARLRSLSLAGIALAAERGVLRFGTFHGLAAWFVTDRTGRIAQARRLDGQPWTTNVKAWTLRHSQGAWPVGIHEAAPFPVIALVEGGPDLLAAHHFITTTGHVGDVAAVALLGAAMSIHPFALSDFVGKRVRIFTHSDKAGRAAGIRWASQVEKAGGHADSLAASEVHPEAKDLNDLAHCCDTADRTLFP